ncbi:MULTISPECIES: bifunctional pyr operon transcriptional regulator/uracil phosphoribosyltransferase PyrR [unclassified Aggregatibacter]|jgi:bifunctional protein pyrR|uniref:bifunctional pyr operon transcriptional regulator/uracil phosphoribosyltransferase PyrR n=1 Tax=unclassified Aggregatibacter TaxID=2639383 RepID=UPI0003967655|nr:MULTISPECIES: bifunctional pyr operon transcriptional regulator/uracil phosphoribosyltransferase PyrR [unclassified Aggregatibacter]ERH27882.1 putative pyrimidine operon regulatory protein/uracil phosphoribosyltransferase PyrR [Aggregatibacter sp. oral taxon 458 str. W10330]QTO01752.1 bifunctional pyr operon transcriptional regulator/uracil phosphoribosyltransferase PyrR [Aggregatibacter sp. 2125159857]VTX77844.1 Bifunctional protein PyrR [uncultured Aggregatibacter sp.]
MEKIIVDENQFLRTISRISHEIIEKHQTLDNLVIVGIKRRGAEIAELIRQKIMALTQVDVPSFDLDITFYRDDLSLIEEEMSPIYKGASMQMNIQNKEIILVDDVLFTGRTIRAALDALTDFGRASRIELVIFVDRGHRELPIRADYVGKNVPTSRNENIQVRTKQFDQCYEVALLSK